MANLTGKKFGGRQKGSTNKINMLGTDMALSVLACVDQKAIWMQHVKDKDPRVSIEALKYLCDRAFGKPAQALQLQGDKDKPLEVIIRVIGK